MAKASGSAPDYSDESLAIGYQRARGKDTQHAMVAAQILEEMRGRLAAYARSRNARLVGDLDFDFPNAASLPRQVRREMFNKNEGE